jgi:hypothetical protein
MDAPDLIIPIRMDPSKATAALTAVAGGAKKATVGVQELGAGAQQTTKTLLAIQAAQVAFNMIRQSVAAVSQEYKRAADYVKSLANDFADLRKSMQEVTTLRGQANDDKFTVEQAKKAQQYGLTSAQYRDFQAECLNYAGSQVGDITQGAKLTEEQSDEYAGRVAELMKGSGISPQIGAKLAGSLLENAKGPQDVDKLMERLSRIFQVLEKGRVPMSRALPQISEIMGMGVSAEDTAKMFSIVSPAALGEEGTHVQAGLQAIEDMKIEGTDEEFGVKRGMSKYESVKAFAESMNKRKQELIDAGKTDQEATDEIAALLKEKGVAGTIHERRGLVAGFGRQGVEFRGFQRYEKIEHETPTDFEAQRRQRYERSDQGKADVEAIREAVGQAIHGEREQAVKLELDRAHAQVTESGVLKEPTMVNSLREKFGAFGGVDVEQQLTNRRALANLTKRAVELGIPTTGDERTAKGRSELTIESLASQDRINDDIRTLLRAIKEAIEKQAAVAGAISSGALTAGVTAALSAPPVGGAGKRGS